MQVQVPVPIQAQVPVPMQVQVPVPMQVQVQVQRQLAVAQVLLVHVSLGQGPLGGVGEG